MSLRIVLTEEMIEWMAEFNAHHYTWNAQLFSDGDTVVITMTSEDGLTESQSFNYN